MKHNVVGWFEIPVIDMDRAARFYETVLKYKLERHTLGDLEMAWFPMIEGDGCPGSLVKNKDYMPSGNGTVIYFTSPSGDLSNEISRVQKAGGKILQEKTKITDEIGYMGLFLDTEGNRIAIHSRE